MTNKYKRFNIVWSEQSKQIMQQFIPIEIIYKPVKNCNKVINCYFSNKINLAFRSTFSENGILRHGTAFQCHFCSNYYEWKDKCDCHLDSCTGKPEYIYNSNTQYINTFHPELEIDKVITEYSFGHTEYTVTSLNYLTVDQLNFKNNKTLLKLRDFALNVARKKSKLVIAEICSPQNWNLQEIICSNGLIKNTNPKI